MPSPNPLNVLRTPLALFSLTPPTGFYRTGYCHAGPDDPGNHSVAAIVTEPFLDFTASRGNDLRSVGLKEGCRWCLCASRWKEALVWAKKEGKEDMVPRVVLEASGERALSVVGVEQLREFEAKKE